MTDRLVYYLLYTSTYRSAQRSEKEEETQNLTRTEVQKIMIPSMEFSSGKRKDVQGGGGECHLR